MAGVYGAGAEGLPGVLRVTILVYAISDSSAAPAARDLAAAQPRARDTDSSRTVHPASVCLSRRRRAPRNRSHARQLSALDRRARQRVRGGKVAGDWRNYSVRTAR